MECELFENASFMNNSFSIQLALTQSLFSLEAEIIIFLIRKLHIVTLIILENLDPLTVMTVDLHSFNTWNS